MSKIIPIKPRAKSDYKRDVIKLSSDAAMAEALKQMAQGAAMFRCLIDAGARLTPLQMLEMHSVNLNILEAYERLKNEKE